MKMCKTKIEVVKERPDFGDKQVRQASEVEMEKLYRWHCRRGMLSVIFPIRKEDNGIWIKAKQISDEPVTMKDIAEADIGDVSLADCGVIPYKGGMWNGTNWLEKLEE